MVHYQKAQFYHQHPWHEMSSLDAIRAILVSMPAGYQMQASVRIVPHTADKTQKLSEQSTLHH